MSKKSPYANLTKKEKLEHIKLLEDAVLRAKSNLDYWESSLKQLRKEVKS